MGSTSRFDVIEQLLVHDGNLYAIGSIRETGVPLPVNAGVLRWQAGEWRSILNESVFYRAFAACSFQGELVVATDEFVTGSFVTLSRVRNGELQVMGSAVSNAVFALQPWQGHLFVGGAFDRAGDRISPFIARWDE
jgi:hypothetical protein